MGANKQTGIGQHTFAPVTMVSHSLKIQGVFLERMVNEMSEDQGKGLAHDGMMSLVKSFCHTSPIWSHFTLITLSNKSAFAPADKQIYMDNFSTRCTRLKDLSHQGIRAAGMLRTDRKTGEACPVTCCQKPSSCSLKFLD
ncbi:uncharacterized protein LOC101862161 [Aplysia californica]|uniref:Uncharacterized protein LOC101862161 n=1 Tax=Aplysia californica TaxID=6500 RepID=A0ABM0KAC9_APLCA|nr:uncharacterized protein LOC101862161 [Aplysia californica]